MIFSNYTSAEVLQKTLALLEKLCAISSPSGDVAGLEKAARRLGDELERRGLEVAIERETGDGDARQPVLHAVGQDAGERYLLLVGHLDTVLDARPPECRDGRLWATGAIDMKGGLAALVGALDLLKERGVEPPRDLRLVVVPDEEVAGVLSLRAMERLGGAARGLWVLEPGKPRGDGETLVAGRRGMCTWRLAVTGRGAHAGSSYWQGRSALDAAARWCVAAKGLAAKGPGPTVNVARIVAGDRDFVEDLATEVAILGTQRRLNVVPDRARAEGEARFLRSEDGEVLRRELQEEALAIAEEDGVEIELTFGQVIAPVDPHGPGRAWSERAVRLAAKRGWRLEVEEDRGGISFSNFLPDPAAIPILDGLGPVGDGMHTREEYVELVSLDRRIALLADLLAAEATG